MTMNKVREIVKEHDDRILFLEEKFDKALIGTGKTCGGNIVAVYNASECIKILINDEKMDELDALEKFEKSIAVPGTYKPIFIDDFRKMKELPDFEIKDDETTIKDLFNN